MDRLVCVGAKRKLLEKAAELSTELEIWWGGIGGVGWGGVKKGGRPGYRR